mgnify:CR=1 FL=1
MTDPFIGEIRINSFNFAPQGWASCNGQTLAIQQNAALYSLIGYAFGGDKVTNFNLPDLRGRTPVGFYTSSQTIGQLTHYNMGDAGGAETVTLTTTQIPTHIHSWACANTVGATQNPTGGFYAQAPATANIYTALPSTGSQGLTAFNPKIMGGTGGDQAHNNMQPFLVLNFVIALSGVYPPRQ